MTELRVDELARSAGTTVRNVRVYQDRGLLPPPVKQGRVGIYSEQHLARLRLIGSLLERGFTFAHIAEFITGMENGADLHDVLGLEEALTAPWTEDEPVLVTARELKEMVNATWSPRVLARASRMGLVKREGTHFRVMSPTLLRAGGDLVSAGVPLEVALELAEALQTDARTIAARFVDAVLTHVIKERDIPHGPRAAEVADTIQRLRPQARAAVIAAFGQAMQDEVTTIVGERVAHQLEER